MSKSGIYIHFPFCSSRCLYCAFYSTVSAKDSAIQDRYVNALINEMRDRQQEFCHQIKTVYFGGGTPSLCKIESLQKIINALKTDYNSLWSPEEFTMEINPDNVSSEYINSLINLGVTRFSMGIQSFNDNELRRIGRRHSAETAIKACNIILSSGADLSIDLICGLPEQTLVSWDKSISTAIAIKPHHISAYMLELEDGTPLTKLYQAGKLNIPDDDATAEMYSILCNKLAENNYVHYEISNFCLPGHHSRHNSSYWDGTPYIGLGPGACSYDGDKTRRENPPSLNNYLSHFEEISRITPYFTEEILDADQLKTEYILTRLRCKKGININEFKNKFGVENFNSFISECQQFLKNEELELHNDILTLSAKGILISDNIMASLI